MAPRILVALVTALTVAPALAQSGLSRQDADRFHQKLTQIVTFGAVKSAARSTSRATQLTDT